MSSIDFIKVKWDLNPAPSSPALPPGFAGGLPDSALTPPPATSNQTNNTTSQQPDKIDKLLSCNATVNFLSLHLPAVFVVVLAGELIGLILWVVLRIATNNTLPSIFGHVNNLLRIGIMLVTGLYIQRSLYVRNMWPGLWPDGGNNYKGKANVNPAAIAALIAGAGGLAAVADKLGGIDKLAALAGGLGGLAAVAGGFPKLFSALGGAGPLLAAFGGISGLILAAGGIKALASAFPGGLKDLSNLIPGGLGAIAKGVGGLAALTGAMGGGLAGLAAGFGGMEGLAGALGGPAGLLAAAGGGLAGLASLEKLAGGADKLGALIGNNPALLAGLAAAAGIAAGVLIERLHRSSNNSGSGDDSSSSSGGDIFG